MSCACGRGTPGWKPDPGVCPRDDDHGPANGHCACIHEPDGGIEPRVTAPDARQSDELREALVDIARAMNPLLHDPLMTKVAEEWVDEHILPAVTAWHEKAAEAQARARAAEELEGWARSLRRVGQFGTRRDSRRIFPQVADLLEAGARDLRTDHWADRADALTGDGIDWAEVAAALAADDRTDPA